MPVTVTGNRFDTFIQEIEQKLNSPDLIQQLGESLAESLKQGFLSSGLQSQSGATVAALTFVGEPEQTGNGWRIGVGNAEEAGHPEDPAPTGTLRAFFNDFQRAFPGSNLRPTEWRRIPPDFKTLLEAERRAGMYGGRGPMYANYLWAQNYGSGAAHIAPHGYIDPALESWRQQVPDMIREYFRAQTS